MKKLLCTKVYPGFEDLFTAGEEYEIVSTAPNHKAWNIRHEEGIVFIVRFHSLYGEFTEVGEDTDLYRKDKCEPVEGELFPGGYALVTGGELPFLGKMMLLIGKDDEGFWTCFDSLGDVLIFDDSDLMPVSKKGLNEKWDIDKLLLNVEDAA